MSSLNAKDRVSLCLFSFTDGRRCRTPRSARHPHFCFYHAQKEAQAQAAETLSKDLACFFSRDYLSACDLSTALARLIPAVIRGDIKPRLARTVAYMFQTQLQAIHIAQHEYINAFGTDGRRKAIRTSVNANYDHRFPTAPEPEQPAPPTPPQIQTQPPIPAQVRPNLRHNPRPERLLGPGLPGPSAPISPVPSPQPPLLASTRNPSKINTYSDSRNRKFPQHLRRA